jgi:hypothetical protein
VAESGWKPIDNPQETLLDVVEWKQHWKDMPEFVQEELKPFAQIIVRFATEEDLRDFNRRIGQDLAATAKSTWHPKAARSTGVHFTMKRAYVDES